MIHKSDVPQYYTQQSGSILKYIDMNASSGGVARETLVTDLAWTTVFSYTGSGKIYNYLLNIETKDKWLIRLIIDSEDVFGSAGINTTELISDAIYDLDNDISSDGEFGLLLGTHDKFFWHSPEFDGTRYSISVQIQIKRVTGEASKKFRAGLIVLTKE